jgi:alpha-glucosidase (family GH31 glycosyl hydrolase)
MWLHDPGDPDAVKRGDQYMWGPDLLVAPVVEKGAESRRVYLPRGTWIDFWNHKRVSGGVEVDREVDLSTMPIYVRAGTVLPMGPVKQYVNEKTSEPTTLTVFPGSNGSSFLYEDDGESFAYRQGAWMRIAMTWNDATRQLSLRLAGGRLLPPSPRPFIVQVAGASDIKTLTFDGRPVSVRL